MTKVEALREIMYNADQMLQNLQDSEEYGDDAKRLEKALSVFDDKLDEINFLLKGLD